MDTNEEAFCDTCGWVGLVRDLVDDPLSPVEERCPACNSPDTKWGESDED